MWFTLYLKKQEMSKEIHICKKLKHNQCSQVSNHNIEFYHAVMIEEQSDGHVEKFILALHISLTLLRRFYLSRRI